MSVDKLTPNDSRVTHHTTNLNGKNYHYLLGQPEGTPKATIFLIHGWPDLSFAWRNQIPLLVSLGLRVVAPDMMGYGGTDAPEEIEYYTYKRAADDMATLAAELNAPHIMLGGHDWGGAIVYRIALRYPKLVTSVFSICTPYFAPRTVPVSLQQLVDTALPNFKYQQHLRGPEVEATIVGPEKLRQFFKGMYGGKGPNGELIFDAYKGVIFENLPKVGKSPLLDDEELEYYVQQYNRTGMHGPLNWYRVMELNGEQEVEIAKEGRKIEVPVMFVQATRDTALPPKMSAGMDAYFPAGLKRAEVDANHWALWERAVECNALIEEWVTEQLSAKSHL